MTSEQMVSVTLIWQLGYAGKEADVFAKPPYSGETVCVFVSVCHKTDTRPHEFSSLALLWETVLMVCVHALQTGGTNGSIS